MRCSVALLLLLAACADKPKIISKQDTPAATVESFLANVKAANRDAALAFMTPEVKERETFTRTFLGKVKSYDIQEPQVDGANAVVRVKAVFDVNGKDDREGLHFLLVRKEGTWWIARLE